MIKQLLSAVLILSTCLLIYALPAHADSPNDLFPDSVVCNNEQNSGTSTVCTDKIPDADNNPSTIDSFNPISGSNGILLDITNIVDYAIGAGSIIMVLIGSIRYMVSSGDSNKISAAKNTVIYALVGVAVAVITRVLIIWVVGGLK